MSNRYILILGTVGREKVDSFGEKSPEVFGGTAFYAAEAVLKGSESQPIIVSCIGNDLALDFLMAQFSRTIPSIGVSQHISLPSFFWEAKYIDSFEVSETVALENRVISDFTPDWSRLRDEHANVGYCYLAAFDPEIQLACIDHFPGTMFVAETLDYWIKKSPKRILEVFRQSQGVVVTEREFHSLWGSEVSPFSSHEVIGTILVELDLEFLIVTFASRGSQVFEKSGTYYIPAIECDTKDSTGAGNAFTGGLVSYLSRFDGFDSSRLPDAVALGTALAALQVQDFGNLSLRRAEPQLIAALQQQARNGIMWSL